MHWTQIKPYPPVNQKFWLRGLAVATMIVWVVIFCLVLTILV